MKGAIKPEVRQLDSNAKTASVWPWATYLMTLGFNFLICKKGGGVDLNLWISMVFKYVLSKQAILE